MADKRRKSYVRSLSKSRIREIALWYTNDSNAPTILSACDKFGITEYKFALIIERAIVEMIVDFKTAEKIRERSIKNQAGYSRKGNPNTIKHYKDMFEKRLDFYKKNLEFSQAAAIGVEYINTYIRFYSLANKYGLSKSELFYCLKYGLLFCSNNKTFSFFIYKLYNDLKGTKFVSQIKELEKLRAEYNHLLDKLHTLNDQLHDLADFIDSEAESEGVIENIEHKIYACEKEIESFKRASL